MFKSGCILSQKLHVSTDVYQMDKDLFYVLRKEIEKINLNGELSGRPYFDYRRFFWEFAPIVNVQSQVWALKLYSLEGAFQGEDSKCKVCVWTVKLGFLACTAFSLGLLTPVWAILLFTKIVSVLTLQTVYMFAHSRLY